MKEENDCGLKQKSWSLKLYLLLARLGGQEATEGEIEKGVVWIK